MARMFSWLVGPDQGKQSVFRRRDALDTIVLGCKRYEELAQDFRVNGHFGSTTTDKLNRVTASSIEGGECDSVAIRFQENASEKEKQNDNANSDRKDRYPSDIRSRVLGQFLSRSQLSVGGD